jgi:short-subunit dehydrogenase
MTSHPSQQRAIITGASRGIGKATALAFAKAGINLALISRSQESLEALADNVRELGVKAHAYPLDLSKTEDVKAKIEAIVQDFGGVDILVNNAGIGYTNTLTDTPLSDWQQVMEMNLTSIFQCVMGVLATMRQQRSGTIINVTSIAATTVFPGWGAYCVSKAGLLAFTQVLALEEKSNGIRVMNISPGAVNTSIWDTDTVTADLDRSLMLTPETVAESILQMALLPPEAVIENLTLMPSAGTL